MSTHQTTTSLTPIKRGTAISHLRTRQSALNVRMAMNEDLQGLRRIVPTDRFLDAIFPGHGTLVDCIFHDLLGETYTNGKWKDMPVEAQKEAKLYKPFVDVANTINKSQPVVDHLLKTNDKPVGGVWVHRPNKSPSSRDDDIAVIRPDAMLVANAQHIVDLDETITSDEAKGGLVRQFTLISLLALLTHVL